MSMKRFEGTVGLTLTDKHRYLIDEVRGEQCALP